VRTTLQSHYATYPHRICDNIANETAETCCESVELEGLFLEIVLSNEAFLGGFINWKVNRMKERDAYYGNTPTWKLET